jgi:PTH1 family peptidyl-tRNA hydrolase
MKLIIGLGNPGSEYCNNRHNVGHIVADALLAKPRKDLVIKKTDCFMNESGICVKRLLTHYSLLPNALYIIHDDLDIKLGEYKIQFGKGPKVHHGLESIDQALGTSEYWRVRVGVDNRPPAHKATEGADYVLADFTKEEQEVLQNVIFDICKKLATL